MDIIGSRHRLGIGGFYCLVDDAKKTQGRREEVA